MSLYIYIQRSSKHHLYHSLEIATRLYSMQITQTLKGRVMKCLAGADTLQGYVTPGETLQQEL